MVIRFSKVVIKQCNKSLFIIPPILHHGYEHHWNPLLCSETLARRPTTILPILGFYRWASE
jgi:hypothetical protein